MAQIPYKSIARCFGILLILTLSFNCSKDEKIPNASQPKQTSSLTPDGSNVDAPTVVLFQTKTANLFYNYSTNQYVQWGAQYVAADDNSYAYTKKVNSLQRIYLILQDFRFTIPSNAVIGNITARIRRFKSGRSEVKDCFVHLIAPFPNPEYEGWMAYGPEMAKVAVLWPGSEAEASYYQTGSGNNGIDNPETHTTKPYQWTPAIINNSAFGFYLLTSFAKGGFYYAYFDQVQITVEYSLP
jgi:hypothetical protein